MGNNRLIYSIYCLLLSNQVFSGKLSSINNENRLDNPIFYFNYVYRRSPKKANTVYAVISQQHPCVGNHTALLLGTTSHVKQDASDYVH